MNRLIYICFILLFPGKLFAQDTASIEGVVSDDTGKPLPYITILIKETGSGVASDEQGNFKLTGMRPGEYTLVITGIGYEKQIRKIQLQANQPLRADVYLKESTLEIDGLVITGESQASVLQKQGFELETIETRAFQTQSIELNRILDQSAGIRVRREGGFGSRASFSINGMGGKAVRFFLDGVPMDYFGSSYSVSTIPVSLIRRIDIYKGVVPVELGNDALGGAINLVTKENVRNSAEVSYSYGSFNTHTISLQGKWREENSGATFKLSTFYNYSDNNYKVWGKEIYITDPETFEVERNIKAERFHDAFESGAVKLDAGFTEKSWADQFFVGVLYSKMNKEIQHKYTTMETPFGKATYNQRVAMPYLVYQLSDFIATGVDVNLFTAYSSLVRNQVDTARAIYNWYGEVEGYRTTGGEQRYTLNTLSERAFINRLNLVYHFHQKHDLGFNYVVNDLRRTDNDPLINLSEKTDGYYAPQLFQKHSMSGGIQSEWLHSRLHTSVFVKRHSFNSAIKVSEYQGGVETYRNLDTEESGFGYGLAGSYRLSPGFKINFSSESAVRLPEANEILGDNGLGDANNPDLHNESSFNVNLGFNLHLDIAPANSEIRLSANSFYRNVKGLIHKTYAENVEGLFQYQNVDDVIMKGVDAHFQYSFNDLISVSQAASYLNPIVKTDTDTRGNKVLYKDERLSNIPFFQANSELRFNLGRFLKNQSDAYVFWNMGYVGGFYKYPEAIARHNKDKIPEQLINNAGAGYTFPGGKLSLSLDVNNIFNEQAFDNFAIQKPGRAAYVKLLYTIM